MGSRWIIEAIRNQFRRDGQRYENDFNELRILSVSSEDDQGNDIICAICLENRNKTEECKIEPCSHRFCTLCLYQWMNFRLCCPKCRQAIKKLWFKNDYFYEAVIFETSPNTNTLEIEKLFRSISYLILTSKCLFQRFQIENERNNNLDAFRLTYNLLENSISYKINNPYTLLKIYRFLIYNYNMTNDTFPNFQYNNNSNPQDSTQYSSILRIFDPRRLFNFIEYDLKILKNLFRFHLKENANVEIFNLCQHELTKLDANFWILFRKIILNNLSPNTTKKNKKRIIDLSFKLFQEAKFFIHSDFNQEIETYFRNTSYKLTRKSSDCIDVSSEDSDVRFQRTITAQKFYKNSCRKKEAFDINKPGPSGIRQSTKIDLSNFKRNSLSFRKKSKNAKGNKMNGKKVLKTIYSKRQLHKMRRVIRYAETSNYFFRKLILEIEKKFRKYETVLNDRNFDHMVPYFRNILLLFKKNRIKTLADIRVLNRDETRNIKQKQQAKAFSNQNKNGIISQSMSTGSGLSSNDECLQMNLKFQKFSYSNDQQHSNSTPNSLYPTISADQLLQLQQPSSSTFDPNCLLDQDIRLFDDSD